MKKGLLFFSAVLFALLTTQAQDTELWGHTAGGATQGSIFKLNKDRDFEHIEGFNAVEGRSPQSTDMIQGSDGLFYGMTRQGGSSGYGVIFSYDASGGGYNKIHDFDNIQGGES